MTTGDTMDMESLVALSRDGDRAALDALIYEIQPSIHKLAQRFLMIPADAEDATQEILLKIITRLAQFEGKSQFKTWAYTVASNHLLDLKRKPSVRTLIIVITLLSGAFALYRHRSPVRKDRVDVYKDTLIAD